MIVATTRTAARGHTPVCDFRDAPDEATAVAAFTTEYGLDAADYIGFDTGWTQVTSPRPRRLWAYDHDRGALVQLSWSELRRSR